MREPGTSQLSSEVGASGRAATSDKKKSPPRGRPNARATKAEAEEEPGVGGPHTSEEGGERLADGPDGAKAARVAVNFRRETCPQLRLWKACHQNC